MEPLRFSSSMAQNADAVCHAIARYAAERLRIPTEFANDLPWQERESLFDRGVNHVCWVCGLGYVLKSERRDFPIELLAAPVMEGARYGGRAIYFSDVVVHQNSTFCSFADLRLASWSFNESGSHSGYNLTRAYL